MLMPSKESWSLNSAFASDASDVGSRVAAATTTEKQRPWSLQTFSWTTAGKGVGMADSYLLALIVWVMPGCFLGGW